LEIVSKVQQLLAVTFQFAGELSGGDALGDAADDQDQFVGSPSDAVQVRAGEGVEDPATALVSEVQDRGTMMPMDHHVVLRVAAWASQALEVQPSDELGVAGVPCAGLDVHTKTVVAYIRRIGPTGQAEDLVRTFGTMTGDLLEMADWLASHAGRPHLISSIEQSFLAVLLTRGVLQSLGLDPAPATRLAIPPPQREAPEHAQVRRGMIGADPALVLAEAHVPRSPLRRKERASRPERPWVQARSRANQVLRSRPNSGRAASEWASDRTPPTAWTRRVIRGWLRVRSPGGSWRSWKWSWTAADSRGGTG
jgi:hypothetical protein